MPARARKEVRQARCHAYPDFRRLMFLPGGAWVFETSDDEAPVYGDSFIMHTASGRAAPHASRQMQGLVPLKQRQTGVAIRSPQPSTQIVPLSLEDVEVSIVVLPAEESTGIVPFRQMLLEAETGNSTNSDPTEASSSCLAIVPKDNTMLGIVMGSAVRRRDDVPLPMNDDSVYETFNTKHPRRTMKIKFKCKLCNATTIKPINPHAWTSGSVFARCGRCNITHKLIDNLKLFHELAGPVFNTPLQPQSNLAGKGGNPAGQQREGLQDSGNLAGQEQPGLQVEHDVNGFPVLPERLQLRFNWQPPQDFPDDTSNYN